MKKEEINLEAFESLEEMDASELEEIIGAGKNGQFYTISHECHWNTWQGIFGCC